MAPRRNSSQVKAQLRQIQQRQQHAIRNYNNAVNDYNREVKRRVNAYNQAVRDYNHVAQRHNNAVRQHRTRLQQELNRLTSRPAATTRSTVAVRTSVATVVEQFRALERSAEAGVLDGRWLDLSEREAANSAAVLNALVADADPSQSPGDDTVAELRASDIDTELAAAGGDLTSRWHGALFALHPDNPDAGRHFATSSREMMAVLLDRVAPDQDVLAANPNCPRTPNGSVSRRARIHFCLARQGHDVGALAEFIDADVTNVIDLFDAFNAGTHGTAAKLPISQLAALKERVEDAVRFVHSIAFGLS
jgi:hypothetical protein